MSGHLNATALGRLGQDPELRYTAGGLEVLDLSVCCNLRVKRGGQWMDEATWIRVKCFGKRAEALSKILSKGREIFAQGRLEIRSYERKDGGKGTAVAILADTVQLCGSKGQHERQEPGQTDPYSAPPLGADGGDDDIPF